MCGRFCFIQNEKELKQYYDIETLPLFSKKYNAAPGQYLPIIKNEDKPVASLCRWGLVPFFSKDDKMSSKLINARTETVDSKKSFSNSFANKRCIVPVTGFYEWDNFKNPYLFFYNNNKIFSLAGLWDRWSQKGTDKILDTFTILTMDAESPISKFHNRMPVILKKDEEKKWISEGIKKENLLEKGRSKNIIFQRVSKDINSISNNFSELLDKVDEQQFLF